MSLLRRWRRYAAGFRKQEVRNVHRSGFSFCVLLWSRNICRALAFSGLDGSDWLLQTGSHALPQQLMCINSARQLQPRTLLIADVLVSEGGGTAGPCDPEKRPQRFNDIPETQSFSILETYFTRCVDVWRSRCAPSDPVIGQTVGNVPDWMLRMDNPTICWSNFHIFGREKLPLVRFKKTEMQKGNWKTDFKPQIWFN